MTGPPVTQTTILPVRAIEATCAPHRWLWPERERDAVAAHWRQRCAERSGIFNGRVLMVAEHSLVDGVLGLRFFETDYANLLAWLDFGQPDASVANAFAMGALRSADGAFVMGVMGAHTANAGRVYFASGTPDRSDVRADGGVDLAASVTRELEEETGLSAADYRIGEGWVVARHAGHMALLKPLFAHQTGAELSRRIRAHIAAEAEPELDDIRLVRNLAEIEEAAMPAFLPVFLRWSFARDPA